MAKARTQAQPQQQPRGIDVGDRVRVIVSPSLIGVVRAANLPFEEFRVVFEDPGEDGDAYAWYHASELELMPTSDSLDNLPGQASTIAREFDERGQPVCQNCRRPTNASYAAHEKLTCWNCRADMGVLTGERARAAAKRETRETLQLAITPIDCPYLADLIEEGQPIPDHLREAVAALIRSAKGMPVLAQVTAVIRSVDIGVVDSMEIVDEGPYDRTPHIAIGGNELRDVASIQLSKDWAAGEALWKAKVDLLVMPQTLTGDYMRAE